jgi:hypothetical protein
VAVTRLELPDVDPLVVPIRRRPAALADANPALFRSLLRAGNIGLRKRRTVDAEGSLLVQLISIVGNHHQRHTHALPGPAEEPSPRSPPPVSPERLSP